MSLRGAFACTVFFSVSEAISSFIYIGDCFISVLDTLNIFYLEFLRDLPDCFHASNRRRFTERSFQRGVGKLRFALLLFA
jgi:hypothetical protein